MWSELDAWSERDTSATTLRQSLFLLQLWAAHVHRKRTLTTSQHHCPFPPQPLRPSNLPGARTTHAVHECSVPLVAATQMRMRARPVRAPLPGSVRCRRKHCTGLHLVGYTGSAVEIVIHTHQTIASRSTHSANVGVLHQVRLLTCSWTPSKWAV
jgi:hypothetical protein